MARIGSYPIDAVIQDKDAWIGTENTNRVTRQFTAKGIAEYMLFFLSIKFISILGQFFQNS